mgnify:CR=1 FL=1
MYKRQAQDAGGQQFRGVREGAEAGIGGDTPNFLDARGENCLLYTSDAADDLLCVDLGGRRIIKKKNQTHTNLT